MTYTGQASPFLSGSDGILSSARKGRGLPETLFLSSEANVSLAYFFTFPFPPFLFSKEFARALLFFSPPQKITIGNFPYFMFHNASPDAPKQRALEMAPFFPLWGWDGAILLAESIHPPFFWSRIIVFLFPFSSFAYQKKRLFPPLAIAFGHFRLFLPFLLLW